MTLGKFLKEFYGNHAIALSVSNSEEYDGQYHAFYECALTDIPEEQLEYKVLAVYPWSAHYIGISCRGTQK